MRYIVEFEVENGDCEFYKQFDENDTDSACNTCPLKGAYYCMDLNMHKAKVVKANFQYPKEVAEALDMFKITE